jgi:hypothetical protein
MQQRNELQHTMNYLSDDISAIGSGTFATDVVHLGIRNDSLSHRIIRRVKHPLTDHDLDPNAWTMQRLEQFRGALMDLDASRELFWSGQPVDNQRVGRRVCMARQYSIKVIESAIGSTKQSERRNRSLAERGLCLVM